MCHQIALYAATPPCSRWTSGWGLVSRSDDRRRSGRVAGNGSPRPIRPTTSTQQSLHQSSYQRLYVFVSELVQYQGYVSELSDMPRLLELPELTYCTMYSCQGRPICWCRPPMSKNATSISKRFSDRRLLGIWHQTGSTQSSCQHKTALSALGMLMRQCT